MPGDSIRLRLIQNVADSLRAINAASGYYLTVQPESVKTEPADLLTAPGPNLPMFLVAASQRAPRIFHPSKRVRETVAVDITAAADVGDTTDPTAKLTACEQLAADMEKALALDITRGQIAMVTRVLDPQFWMNMGNQARVIVVQPVDIEVQRIYGQPDQR